MRLLFADSEIKLGAVLRAAGLSLLALPSFAAARPHHHGLPHAIVRHASVSRSVHTEHAYSSLSMSSERATEIQTALIGKGYLSGEPTGSWDSASVAAMQKLQGENGWQTKIVPDSRALIKLGLGPGSTPTITPSGVSVPLDTAHLNSTQTN